MAISKTQNERPALIALIDAANQAELDIQTLDANLMEESEARAAQDATLQASIAAEAVTRASADTNLQNQIGEGFSSALTIAQSLSATNRAVQTISDEIGLGFTSENTVTDAIVLLQTWQNRFRLGLTPSLTVEIGDSVSDTLSFATPFDNTAEVAVFLVCVDGAEILTDLSCKLISATYSGFSFAVFNDSQADVTIKVGFLAVRMN